MSAPEPPLKHRAARAGGSGTAWTADSGAIGGSLDNET
jgi:hypothetical protein